MNEKEKLNQFNLIKGLLNDLDKTSQLSIIWMYLSFLMEDEPRHVTWVLEQLEKVIDREGEKLIT